MKDKQTFHIAGQGAIGSLLTANLVKANIPVVNIVKGSESPSKVFNTLERVQIPLPTGKPLNEINQICNLVVPLKAFAIEAFLESIVSKLTIGANVILCHNGLGTIEHAKQILNNQNLYFCTTNQGVYQEGNQVFHAGNGPTYWRDIHIVNEDTQLDPTLFQQLFGNAQYANDLDALLWKKLFINTAINPLTALHNVLNGELSQPQFQSLVTNLISEAQTVANAAGIEIKEDMLKVVNDVIQATSKNKSSMLQDVSAGKRSEIDFITGYILKLAQQHHIATPFHAQVYQEFKQQFPT